MAVAKKMVGVFNTTLIVQSAPSLLISLVGMLLTGLLFEISIKQKKYRVYPIILESGCILSFKGNIELSLAMHLSSLRSDRSGDAHFGSAAFYNSTAVLAQSFVTGFVAGIIGVINSMLNQTTDPIVFTRIIIASALTCFATSLIFIISLLVSIEIARLLEIDTENFILPVLSTVNDFIIVKGLLLSTELMEVLSGKECIVIGFGLSCLFVISLFFAIKADNLMPFNAIEILGVSYILTVFSGFILERYSSIFLHIATAFPVFAGMCGSISFIYIHRRFRLFQTKEKEQMSQHPTLLLISLIMAISYILFAKLFNFRFTTGFCIMFVLMFLCQVSIVLYMIESISKYMKNENKSIGTNTLPIVASVSDLLSAIVLVTTAFILKETIQ